MSADSSGRRRRERPFVETQDFLRFAGRVVDAAGARVAAGDPEALRALAELADRIERTIDTAVPKLHEAGFSWADIARPLGISRQRAHKKWGTDSTESDE